MTTENKAPASKTGQPDASHKTCSTNAAKAAPNVSAPSAPKVEMKKDAAAPAPSHEQKKK